MGKWKFNLEGWPDFAGTVLSAVVVYLVLILFIRLSGKRTLAKMNVFDFVCIVALGSTVATALLSPSVPLSRGVLIFALLILLQVIISKIACRSPKIESLVNGKPRLLVS